MRIFIIVNNPSKWPFQIDGVEIVAAKAYLTDTKYSDLSRVTIFNLCRSYRYQSVGYYVSLLAAARGHRAFPNVETIQNLKSQALIRIASEELDQVIQKSLSPIQSSSFTLSIYFGRNLAKRHQEISLELFNQFEAPLLRAQFTQDKEKQWQLQSIAPIPEDEISEEHKLYVVQFAQDYFKGRRFRKPKRIYHRYDLAILVNPQDPTPPSNEKALKLFEKAAESLELGVEFITRDDYSRLAEFDALFIRETTNVNHHTYRFAERAAAEGLVVIDDPESILKCTNKVYLAELLLRNSIMAPQTLIIHKDNIDTIPSQIGFPCILKQPDSSFSQGVLKVNNEEELSSVTERLLSKSELIIAQRFLPTSFDWRVGVFDNRPLYVCKYFMAKDHWQIYDWSKKNPEGDQYGDLSTISVEEAPKKLISTALKATELIGDGLYGVDIKQVDNKFYIIEVNDNPSIDAGCEDLFLKDQLYKDIMEIFLNRIIKKKEGKKQRV